MWSTIFREQQKLMLRYQQIEGIPPWPVDLNSKQSQEFIRQVLASLFEEMVELCETPQGTDLWIEELSDCVHFVAEVAVLCGVTPVANTIYPKLPYKIAWDDMGKTIGRIMMNMKFKRWKQSCEQPITDLIKFKQEVKMLMYLCMSISDEVGGPQALLQRYQQKNKENHKRISNGY